MFLARVETSQKITPDMVSVEGTACGVALSSHFTADLALLDAAATYATGSVSTANGSKGNQAFRGKTPPCRCPRSAGGLCFRALLSPPPPARPPRPPWPAPGARHCGNGPWAGRRPGWRRWRLGCWWPRATTATECSWRRPRRPGWASGWRGAPGWPSLRAGGVFLPETHSSPLNSLLWRRYL